MQTEFVGSRCVPRLRQSSLGFFLQTCDRPGGSTNKQRKTWYPRWPYLVTLGVAVVVAGFVLGKSPNPMEGVVKFFKSMVGLYPSVLPLAGMLAFFVVLAVIGNKVVCGWACPFGALQELSFSIPGLKKYRKLKLPFWLTNTVRGTLFVVALLLLFGVVGGREGYVVYHVLNPFNLFNLDVESAVTWGVIIGSVVIGFFFYRPFCQFICPFGFLSWFFERISIFRVRVDHDRCNECGACARVCPLQAADGMVKRKRLPADCFSCSRCLNVCPMEAIAYRSVWSSTTPPPEKTSPDEVMADKPVPHS